MLSQVTRGFTCLLTMSQDQIVTITPGNVAVVRFDTMQTIGALPLGFSFDPSTYSWTMPAGTWRVRSGYTVTGSVQAQTRLREPSSQQRGRSGRLASNTAAGGSNYAQELMEEIAISSPMTLSVYMNGLTTGTITAIPKKHAWCLIQLVTKG